MSDLSRSLTVYLLLRANRSQSLNIWAILSNRAKSERANSQPWFWCGDVLKDPVGACNASLMVCFSTCRVINWSGAAPAMSPIKGCCTSRAEINEGASLAMSQSKGAALAESQSMWMLLQLCHHQRVLHQQSRNQCGCYSSNVTRVLHQQCLSLRRCETRKFTTAVNAAPTASPSSWIMYQQSSHLRGCCVWFWISSVTYCICTVVQESYENWKQRRLDQLCHLNRGKLWQLLVLGRQHRGYMLHQQSSSLN